MAMAVAEAVNDVDRADPQRLPSARRVVVSVETLARASDEELVDQIASGSEPALAHVYRLHASHVYALARRIVGDRAHAEDVVQEVFVRLWDRPEAFDGQRGSLRAFLSLHARSRSLDLLRSEGARRGREGVQGRLDMASACDDGPETAMAAGEDIRHLRGAVDVLSPEQRQVIEMAYFEGYTCREVAELLGIPEGTVK
ncbi:MAG TPA: sigma-70 family RNA polymerase sigma factor, partial [Acidimicrobiales bacterium]|nr:sigma-70 family RNA polymerase sigma factor [Acidimicrobiales bacterium]